MDTNRESGAGETLSPRAASLSAGLAIVAFGALWALHGTVVHAVALYADRLPDNPYFVLRHALLLYFGVPLVLVLTVLVALAPGVLLTLAVGKGQRVTEWAAYTLLAAFVVNIPAVWLARFVLGFPSDPSAGRWGLLMAAALSGSFLVARAGSGRVARPTLTSSDRRRLVWLVVIPWLLSAALLPILIWQDFNPDGLEALSMGRSLSEHLVPRLPTGFASGLSLGMLTSSYPVDWFLMWFGPLEVSARAPLLLYAPLLFLLLLGTIELGRPREMQVGEEAVLALAVAAFVVALAYNNSYHPYFADVASPANLDILAVVLMTAMTYFLWRGMLAPLLAASAFATLDRPTGILFIGLLGIGTLLASPKTAIRPLLMLGVAAAVSIVTAAAYERGVVPLLGVPIEDPGAGIGWRLRYFSFHHWERLAYLVVPSGILPAFALFAWPRLDRESRALSFAIVGYFAFFYVRAFVALHHFAPVMILPAVVFWRACLAKAFSRRWTLAVGAAAAVAIVASLPRSLEVNRTVRGIGRATLFEVGDYHGSWEQIREAYDAKGVLDSIFKPFWEVPDPSTELVGASWVQVHYASDGRGATAATRYLVAPADAQLPPAFIGVATSPTSQAAVADSLGWRSDRFRSLRSPFESPLYTIPRETLIPRLGIPAGNYSFDLRSLVGGGP